jgi:two-component system chemotaxis sensor kinase CheA
MPEQLEQNILLVDDHPENLLVLESVLESPGRRFIRAHSGEEALHLILKFDIALILLDIQMPGMDGFETAKLIRGRQRSKHIPIIFITAISKGQQNIFQGYEAGAVDLLFKPVEPEIVRSKVTIFLELDQQRKKLEEQNQQLIEAKKNTDDILMNVEEGFFLLDRNFLIKPQYSQALIRILGYDDLAGKNFISILQKSLVSTLYQNSKDYLELMFKADVDEINFKELNPLIKAEYFDPAFNGVKYLSFNFKRIYSEDQINELIVTVVDHSEPVLLENKLKDSEEQSRRQVDLLHILHSEPLLLKEFLQQTEQDIEGIKTRIAGLTTESDLESIYRDMHAIKGNSSLLEFSYLSTKAHQFEEILKSYAHPLYGLHIDQPALTEILNDMLTTIHDIRSLIQKISSFYEQFNSRNTHCGQLIIKAVSSLVNRLNKELDQRVDLVYKNFDPNLIQAKDFLVLKDILIQMTHNSMTHGIESLAERKEFKKSMFPTITLSSRRSPDALYIYFRDDGRGIQIEALRAKAFAAGKWDEKEISTWSDKQVQDLIFLPGITTARSVNLTAGRGVGMDVVRQKIQKLGGQVIINSQAGKFCEFIIQIPLAKVSRMDQPEIRSGITDQL